MPKIKRFFFIFMFLCGAAGSFHAVNADNVIMEASALMKAAATISCAPGSNTGQNENKKETTSETCTIGADKNATVEISCTRRGKTPNGKKIEKVEISLNNGKGTPCAGLDKRVAVMDLSEVPMQNIFFGGEIILAENTPPDNDANAIGVQIVYQ